MRHEVGSSRRLQRGLALLLRRCASRTARQLGPQADAARYDPFADPKRAAWQEFGDTLAEGLYALLGDGLGLVHADCDYWRDFLHARQMFLKGIVAAVAAGEAGAERVAAVS